jgi:hypothetical protein
MAAHCDSCGRPILWALSEYGKPMPLDPEPRADGNIVLRRLGGTDQPVAHVLKRHELVAEARHVSHFATCPESDLHRRRQRRAA